MHTQTGRFDGPECRCSPACYVAWMLGTGGSRRVWEWDEQFRDRLRLLSAIGIDMETATVFIVGHVNQIPRGALLLVSDTPMTPEGIKTQESDKAVTARYTDLHSMSLPVRP